VEGISPTSSRTQSTASGSRPFSEGLSVNGNVYVRCLTGNAPIGTPKPSYLTVGDGRYQFGNAPHAIDVISNEPGAKTFNVPNGGTAVQNSSSPTKAYAIEVSDPGPAKALDLVESGDIQPVR
jgi:hypothetical protein